MTDHHLSSLRDRLRRDGLLASDPIPAHGAAPDPGLGDVRYDSRTIVPGDLFVARRGQHADGHDHVADAVLAGAAAVLVERPMPDARVPELIVRDAKAALAVAAAWRLDDPSRDLGVIGITGTDGKTTTAYLVRAVLERQGWPAGLLGTTDVIVAGASLGNRSRISTPEAPELQRHLATMRDAGDRWAIVESSSHGLAQHRVGAVAYDIGILTNVTSEHLEFHGTLDAYREAKRSLFARLGERPGNPDKGWGKHAIVNADDAEGEAAADVALAAGATVWRYGLRDDPAVGEADGLDLVATSVHHTPSGMEVAMRSLGRAPGWAGTLTLALAGRFNVYNAMAAMLVARATDTELDDAAAAVASVRSVPGRMQRIDEGQAFTVIVDYAHTAESLAKVLEELRPADPGAGLIAVFGSAGDRDATKRVPMGRVAGERCRLVIATDEDPRSEDPMAILEAIGRGAQAGGAHPGAGLLLIPDRAEAVATAMRAARPGDTVLLAGKGHEKTIESASGERPWDEEAVARAALRALGD